MWTYNRSNEIGAKPRPGLGVVAATLFIREDAVEAAGRWSIQSLKTHHRARPYKRHSWGPKEADALIPSDGGWHNPGAYEA